MNGNPRLASAAHKKQTALERFPFPQSLRIRMKGNRDMAARKAVSAGHDPHMVRDHFPGHTARRGRVDMDTAFRRASRFGRQIYLRFTYFYHIPDSPSRHCAAGHLPNKIIRAGKALRFCLPPVNTGQGFQAKFPDQIADTRPGRERIAINPAGNPYAFNPTLCREFQDQRKYPRQHMHMLMAVHMIWPQTRAKNLLRLRRELVVDVVAADAAEEIVSDKRHVVRTETAVRTDERRNIRWRQTELDLRAGSQGEPLLRDGQVLMEIKIPDAAPLWLARMLSELSLFPTTFSKYGVCYKEHILDDYIKEVVFHV